MPSLQFQRLAILGNIKEAVISPDGKYIASIIEEGGQQDLHVMELATSSDIRIIERSTQGYHGISFSPDGTYIYYLENGIETDALYRVSKLGGGKRKLLTNINTPVTFSPDGSQMAFVRYDLKEQSTVLIVADVDGENERRLAARKLPEYYSLSGDEASIGPVWSPDGQVIASATVDRSSSPARMNIRYITVRDGKESIINEQSWRFIVKLTWLADGSGLVIAGSNSLLAPLQLYALYYPG